jgi:hypothetical protein
VALRISRVEPEAESSSFELEVGLPRGDFAGVSSSSYSADIADEDYAVIVDNGWDDATAHYALRLTSYSLIQHRPPG